MSIESETVSKCVRRYFPVRVRLSAVQDRFIHELGDRKVLNLRQLTASGFAGTRNKYCLKIAGIEYLYT